MNNPLCPVARPTSSPPSLCYVSYEWSIILSLFSWGLWIKDLMAHCTTPFTECNFWWSIIKQYCNLVCQNTKAKVLYVCMLTGYTRKACVCCKSTPLQTYIAYIWILLEDYILEYMINFVSRAGFEPGLAQEGCFWILLFYYTYPAATMAWSML